MICYVVVDTNVLVSALLSKKDNAATVQVLSKVISGEREDVVGSYKSLMEKVMR